MAGRGDKAERDRQREPDPRPDGEGPADLKFALAALDERLERLERATTAFDRRLHAVESHLQIAAPARMTPQAAPPIAERELPPVPPVVAAAPAVPAVAARDAGTIGAAIHSLLDGQPSSRQPGRAPAAAQRGARRSGPAPGLALARKRPALALDELERAVSGRGLALAGGLTLLLGALFFLSLAMSRGWIGVEARVVIGLAAGIVVTALGDRLMRGGDRVLGPVLVAVGIGIWNLALVAGTRFYDLVPLWAALLGAATGAVIATAIAIRANSQVIALYGMMTALAAPMLFAMPAAQTPMAYLVVILAGSTAISVARGWSWLPPAAFVLSQMQFSAWRFAAHAPDREVVLAIASITLLNALAAAGVDRWARTRGPVAIAIALLALNAMSFAVTGALTLSDNRVALGFYLVAGAVAHAALGTLLVRRARGLTPFIYAAYAIAVILLTGAIPVSFEGSRVAIAWAAEALGLLWLAHRYKNGAGSQAAGIVSLLAVWHLFSLEYAPSRPSTMAQPGHGIPFVNEAGLTLLVMLAMLVVAGAIVRERLAHVTFAVIGFGLLIAALPRELTGLALLAGWALLAVLAIAGERPLSASPAGPPLDRSRAWFAANGLKVAAAVAAALAIYRAIVYEMPVLTAAPREAGVAYAGQPAAAAAIITAAALAAAAVTRSVVVRQIAVSVAILIAAHLAAFMLDPAPAVAVWAALAILAWELQRRSSGRMFSYLITSGVLLATGVAVTLVTIAPPTRLLITGPTDSAHPFLLGQAALALAALAAAFFVIAWETRGTPASTWLALSGGVLALYLLSIGIVDAFQRRVDSTASVAELRWQSQVALSVVWAILGGVAVAAGLVRAIPPLRWFGLGLLALATVKVFLYDLASLDAAYRVLSFIVLGILLLLSSYAYRRLGATPERDSIPADDAAPSSAP